MCAEQSVNPGFTFNPQVQFQPVGDAREAGHDIGRPAAQDTGPRGKKTMSAMFDEALRTVSDIPSMIPPASTSAAMPGPMGPMGTPELPFPASAMPFMMFNQLTGFRPPNPMPAAAGTEQMAFGPPQMQANNLMYLNFLAQMNQYQQFMQQMQGPTYPDPSASARYGSNRQFGETMRGCAAPLVEPLGKVKEEVKHTRSRYKQSSEESKMEDGIMDVSETCGMTLARRGEDVPMPQLMENPVITDKLKGTDPFIAPPAEETEARTMWRDNETEDNPGNAGAMERPKTASGEAVNKPKAVPVRHPAPVRKDSANEIEDMPIKVTHKTFEQLIEEQLSGGSGRRAPAIAAKPRVEDSESSPKPKREFLKRRSQAIQPTLQTKKYCYFSDKFAEEESSRNEEGLDQEQDGPKKRAKNAGSYLSKGKGTGGGVGGSNTRPPTAKQEKGKKKQAEEEAQPAGSKKQPYSEISSSIAEFEKLEAECRKEAVVGKKKPAKRVEAVHKSRPSTEEAPASSKKNVRPRADLSSSKKEPVELSFVEEEGEDGHASVKSKLRELTSEMKKMKAERENMKKIKAEYESLLQQLKKDKEEFEEMKEQELASIDELREKELKKVQQEKKVLERQLKANQSATSRPHKEEVESLKKEIARLTEEMKAKCSNNKVNAEKSKRRVEELAARNTDLEDELMTMKEENKRLRAAGQIGERKSAGKENIVVPRTEPLKERSPRAPAKPQLKSPIEPIEEQLSEPESEHDDVGKEYDRSSESEHSVEDQEEVKHSKEQDSEEEHYEIVFHPKYHAKNVKLVNQRVFNNGKISKTFENGKTEILFNNGVRRETFPDGYTVIYFTNNDIKQTHPEGKVVYYFSEAKTTQTSFPDGLQVFKFTTGQLEKHYPDGTKEISFPDGTLKCIFADGEEESIFADGTVQRLEKSGVRAIEYPNGQKEIAFPDGTLIKEFPDGRVRKTFPDGTHENTFIEKVY